MWLYVSIYTFPNAIMNISLYNDISSRTTSATLARWARKGGKFLVENKQHQQNNNNNHNKYDKNGQEKHHVYLIITFTT